jgi:hypothetical protein
VVRLDAPGYASDRSRSPRFRIRWSGSGGARYTLEARRNADVATRWHRLVDQTARTSMSFPGRPGLTYLFRVRARDRSGALSEYSYDETVVPLDDRSRRVRYSSGWLRARDRSAYGGTVTRGRAAGLVALLAFRGSRAALIASRAPAGARVRITVAGRSRLVSLRGPRRHRRVVFRSRRLRPGRHLLRVRTLEGGPAEIDAIGVTTGPAPPRM